jgi:hypothetical protein
MGMQLPPGALETAIREGRVKQPKPLYVVPLSIPLDISEKAFQSHITGLAEHLGYRWFHCYNSRRSPAGFLDLVLAKARRGVIYAELKREGEQPAQAQLEWLMVLSYAGAESYLWRPSMWGQIVKVLTSEERPRE